MIGGPSGPSGIGSGTTVGSPGIFNFVIMYNIFASLFFMFECV